MFDIGIQVLVLGLGIVFSVLIFLVAFINIIKFMKIGDKPTEITPVINSVDEVIEDSGEINAVISAAVYIIGSGVYHLRGFRCAR